MSGLLAPIYPFVLRRVAFAFLGAPAPRARAEFLDRRRIGAGSGAPGRVCQLGLRGAQSPLRSGLQYLMLAVSIEPAFG